MKRNRMMRIASFLLIAVLATTCAISGTFAKYTTEYEATSSARVAKWDVKLSETSGGSALASFDFGLFDTIKDTAGADEADVNANLIAPGTSGSFCSLAFHQF